MLSAPRLSGGERQISHAGRGSSLPIPPHRLPFHPLLSGHGAGVPVPWLVHVCSTDEILPAPAHGAGRAPQPALDTTLETQILQEPAKLLVSSLFMDLADGTNSWSGRGKLSAWLQLCTQPQETPLGSNKHRNKCTEGGLGKEGVPRKQAAIFPSPPSQQLRSHPTQTPWQGHAPYQQQHPGMLPAHRRARGASAAWARQSPQTKRCIKVALKKQTWGLRLNALRPYSRGFAFACWL